MNQPTYQSPASMSNYDRIPNPRVRTSSMAFGLDGDVRHTPPSLRFGSSQNSTQDPTGEFGRSFSNNEPEELPNSASSWIPSSRGEDSRVSVSSLINSIGGLFELTSSEQLDIAKVFNQPNGVAREIATLCYIQRQITNLKKSNNENGAMEGDESEIGGWKGTHHVRTFIRNRVKEAMMSSATQAYATNFTPEGDPIFDSLENLVVQQITAARAKLSDHRLPPGFRNDDINAQGQVRKVIKEIAKVERCKFQNNLLLHIKDPALDTKPPTLVDLLFNLTSNRERSYEKTHADVWTQAEIAEKSRLALLRLEGTIFHLQPKDATVPRKSAMKPKPDRSMWDPVDERGSTEETGEFF
ncbi:hypothetical protein DFH28DRAFT_903355 [Melampsora americana]|nr:hypothetical protein DFH28DRAFT_903355 [Melampsora americana]